jgi:hypothetical protein
MLQPLNASPPPSAIIARNTSRRPMAVSIRAPRLVK